MKADRVLLLTGASSELGCGFLEAAGEEYTRIFAHFHTMNEPFRSITERFGDKIYPVQADFSDKKQVQELIATIRNEQCKIDHILHLTSPRLQTLQYKKTDWEQFAEGLEVSVHSIYEICKAFLPEMVKDRYGRLIFMLTSGTLGLPPKFQSAYITAKYALLGLMKSLAVEYADKGITVNGISPDMMETRFLSYVQELIVQKNAEESPLKRNLCVDDVIPSIRYLLSDGAAVVTGQNLGVTGGIR